MEHCHVTLVSGKDFEAPLPHNWREKAKESGQSEMAYVIQNVKDWWKTDFTEADIANVRVAR